MVLMKKIFAVGDVNVDLFTHISRFAQFGTEAHAEGFHCTLGGNAANFAAASASLGLDVRLVSAIGSDVFTPFIMRGLKRLRIRPLLQKYGLPNGVSNIFVRSDGERAILSSKGCLLELNSALVARRLLPQVSAGDIVFFGGFFHLPKMRKGFLRLLKAIKRKKAIVAFDCCYDEYGNWKIRDFLKNVDIFMLNEVELRAITRAKSNASGIRRLFSMGANHVVLKRGSGGSEYYLPLMGTKPIHSPALSVRALNATGAGDFFNAGFVYGLANSFSALNCLRCGNFAAARKVSSREYCPTLKGDLKDFLRSQNLTEITVKRNRAGVAKEAVQRISFLINAMPNAVISLAAGKTPIPIYRALVSAFRRGEADFSRASFVQLDEYLGLSDSHDSFAHSLKKNFIDKVNFKKENVFLFNVHAKNLAVECRRIESIVKRKGLTVVLLGLGENAHIAFNEPGSSFSSRTRVIEIPRGALSARKARFRGAKPSRALTLGMKTIMGAKIIILAATDAKKARAIAKSFNGKVSERAPASVLRRHPNSAIIVDAAAARKLKKS